MEIHITRGDDWDHIKWFNPATFVCLPQVMTWVSNVICHGIFVFSELGRAVIVCFVYGGCH